MGSTSYVASEDLTPHSLSEFKMIPRIYLGNPPTGLNRDVRHPDGLPFCVTPSLKRYFGGTRILTRFPSTTPFGLALGADLP